MSLWYEIVSAICYGLQALASYLAAAVLTYVGTLMAEDVATLQYLEDPQRRVSYEASVRQRCKYLDMLVPPVSVNLSACANGGNAADGVAPAASSSCESGVTIYELT